MCSVNIANSAVSYGFVHVYEKVLNRKLHFLMFFVITKQRLFISLDFLFFLSISYAKSCTFGWKMQTEEENNKSHKTRTLAKTKKKQCKENRSQTLCLQFHFKNNCYTICLLEIFRALFCWMYMVSYFIKQHFVKGVQYWVFFGPCFSAFGLNLNFRIQFE